MRKNPYSGKFIVFEGLDKSGKSTEAGLLYDYLINQGQDVILTMEPTKGEHQNEVGRMIRRILTGETIANPVSLQLLFAADRGEHLEKIIIPALKEGKIVISDRYFFSSFAYGSLDLDLDWLILINDRFILPDMTILIDVSAEICMKRLAEGGFKQEFFEKEDKLRQVGGTFKKLSGMFENFYVINGEREIPEVFEEIKKILPKVL